MQLEQKHISALKVAETLIFHSDFCPYLALKDLLPDSSHSGRQRFRSLFTTYYGLNAGGLTDKFKDRFFEILFSDKVIVKGQPNFSGILTELYRIKRKQGDYAMQFSFVSKLVGMHQESSPIYDRHVLAFFQSKAPATSENKNHRIEWFVKFLYDVGSNYKVWAKDDRIIPILKKLKAHDVRLKKCDDVRLLDFLVWKVGNQKLLTKPNQ